MARDTISIIITITTTEMPQGVNQEARESGPLFLCLSCSVISGGAKHRITMCHRTSVNLEIPNMKFALRIAPE
jgi:hypothetical protein